MGFIQNIDGCLESAIGDHGLSQGDLDSWLQRLEPGLKSLRQAYETGSLPLLRITEDKDDIEELSAALQKISQGADTLVLFGTGGSSLGGETLAQLGGWYLPGVMQKGQESRPRVRFFDNLDPRSLDGLFFLLKLKETRFIITSKSGNTAEPLAQTLVALKAVKDAGLESEIPNLFLGITEPAQPDKKNALRELFEQYKIPMLPHHTGIGGRYSCLTNVGLLPAMAFGLDPYKIRQGARQLLQPLLNAADPRAISPALGAAVAVGLHKEKGISTSVMMPYTDRLGRFASWYVQLWAESLGKQGQGTTPIAALGPVDQHSQLQMLMDGPTNFLTNLVRTSCQGTGARIDAELARSVGLDYLAGRHIGDLVAAQQDAVAKALVEAGRPVRSFDIDTLDEQALGGLMMHFMIETILAGHLYGVDPFDQPAVEIGKRFAKETLSS